MSSDTPPTNPEDTPGTESGGTEPTVLLLMPYSQDRKLLSGVLERRYEIIAARKREALSQAFDCCLVDQATFTQLRDDLQQRRRDAEVFFPIVLFGKDRTPKATD